MPATVPVEKHALLSNAEIDELITYVHANKDVLFTPSPKRRSRRTIRDPGTLTPEQLNIRSQVLEARDTLVWFNRRLVLHVIHKGGYQERFHQSLDMLYSMGLEGLLDAIDRWHPEQGSFIKYAYLMINSTLKRQSIAQRHMIHIPEDVIFTVNRLGCVPNPTDKDLEENFSAGRTTLREVYNAAISTNNVYSLDYELAEDYTLLDTVGATDPVPVENHIHEALMVAHREGIISQEVKDILVYFYLQGMTLKAISRATGFTINSINFLKRRGLERLAGFSLLREVCYGY